MTWVLRTELGPLEEKRVLLTTELSSPAPRLKSLNYMFFSLLCICEHACTRLTCVHGGQRGSRFSPSTTQVLRLSKQQMCLFLLSQPPCCTSIPLLFLPLRKELYYIICDALELGILLLQAPDFWGCRQALPYPAKVNFFKQETLMGCKGQDSISPSSCSLVSMKWQVVYNNPDYKTPRRHSRFHIKNPTVQKEAKFPFFQRTG